MISMMPRTTPPQTEKYEPADDFATCLVAPKPHGNDDLSDDAAYGNDPLSAPPMAVEAIFGHQVGHPGEPQGIPQVGQYVVETQYADDPPQAGGHRTEEARCRKHAHKSQAMQDEQGHPDGFAPPQTVCHQARYKLTGHGESAET